MVNPEQALGDLRAHLNAPGWRERARQAALSVAIPTYRREGYLIQTLASLAACDPLPGEVLVVDQTQAHEAETTLALESAVAAGFVRWLRHQPPSATASRNRALREAQGEVLLFLDDDVSVDPGLIEAHWRRYQEDPWLAGVAGRVVEPDFPSAPLPYHFRISLSGRVRHNYEFEALCETRGGAGCNVSLRRNVGLSVGGFDERFVGSANNEDADFIARLAERGRFLYDPAASLVHHAARRGGGRSKEGDAERMRVYFHNDAYYFLRRAQAWQVPLYLARQPLTSLRIAQGAYERVFPGLPLGPAAFPRALAACTQGVLAGFRTYLRSKAASEL